MRALDTSVVIPALAQWHEAHDQVVAELRPDDRLPQHVALEAYSVLTRLPVPLRVEPSTAAHVLLARFPPPRLTLPPAQHDALIERLSRAGIRGGAVYDGLVAATAAAAGCLLVTRDRRAARTYRALEVECTHLP